MYQLPIYYIPANIQRPSCVGIAGGIRLDGPGPDGECGGLVIGGQFNSSQIGWRKTNAGWWINAPLGMCPQALRRSAIDPRLRNWLAVPGSQPGHAWAVPILIQPVSGRDGAVSWRSSVDAVLDNSGWSIEPYGDICARLTTFALGEIPTPDAFVALAIDLITLGHHADADLLRSLGWLTESVCADIIVAAGGIEATA